MAGHHIYDSITNLGVLEGEISVTKPDGSESIVITSAGELTGKDTSTVKVFDFTFPESGNYVGPYVITYNIRLKKPEGMVFEHDVLNTAYDNTQHDEKTIKEVFGGAKITKQFSKWNESEQTVEWTITVDVDEGTTLQNVAITEKGSYYSKEEYEGTGTNMPVDWNSVSVSCTNPYDTAVPEYTIERANNRIVFAELSKSVNITLKTKADQSFAEIGNFWAHNKASLKINESGEKEAAAKEKYTITEILMNKVGEMSGTVANWTVDINKAKVSLPPDQDYIPYFEDIIPEHMEVVDGSIKVWLDNSNQIDVSNEIAVKDNKISFSIGSIYHTWGWGDISISGHYFKVEYSTKIKDDYLNEVIKDASKATFTNSAELQKPGSGKVTGASDTVTYEYQNAVKKTDITEEERLKPGAQAITTSQLAYRIEVIKKRQG